MKLHELKYKTEISSQKAWELLNAHCKDSLKNLKSPIVRGMHDSKEISIIHGEVGSRRSKNTSNHYTVILSEVLGKKGFPRRDKSIICGNWENQSYAANYGDLYAIVPFDGVKIGICPENDMFNTPITLGGITKDIVVFNQQMRRANIFDDGSFTDIAQELLDKKSRRKVPEWLSNMKATTLKEMKEELAEAYSKPFKITTTADPIYNDGKDHELWIGGKCVAIHFDIYEKMMKQ